MIRTTDVTGIGEALRALGAEELLGRGASAVIKINLAHPPRRDHPRTHPELIRAVVSFVRATGARCAIAEGANGSLERNVAAIGLEGFVRENGIELIDLDREQDVETIAVDGEVHYLPRRLGEFGCRIAIPATSWRPAMTFSNNVKLFVGAVPLRLYLEGGKGAGPQLARWRVHIDLHRSVANIYRAIMRFAPFQFFVNGGTAASRGRGTFELPQVLVGNDAVELDEKLVMEIEAERPEYLERLRARQRESTGE